MYKGVKINLLGLCCVSYLHTMERPLVTFSPVGDSLLCVHIAQFLWDYKFNEALAELNRGLKCGGDVLQKVHVYHDRRISDCDLLEIGLMRFSLDAEGEPFCRRMCEIMKKDFGRECRFFGIKLKNVPEDEQKAS